jgi:hypothetical protein
MLDKSFGSFGLNLIARPQQCENLTSQKKLTEPIVNTTPSASITPTKFLHLLQISSCSISVFRVSYKLHWQKESSPIITKIGWFIIDLSLIENHPLQPLQAFRACFFWRTICANPLVCWLDG